MTNGGASPQTMSNGDSRYRDLQLQADLSRISDKVVDLMASVEILRGDARKHEGAMEARLQAIETMVRANTAQLEKACAVNALLWEAHKELHEREHGEMKRWSTIVSAIAGAIAGVIGFFGGPTSA